MKNGLVIDHYGNKQWWLNDKLHRDDDLPAVESRNGDLEWWFNGKPHRTGGPAIRYTSCTSFWYMDGVLHRDDGPAIEWATDINSWFLYGIEFQTPEGFENMETWFEKLNTDEEYSLQWINDIKGLINFIANPSGKQIRLHAMKWKL